ncbi:MAG: hypothetical protein ACRD2W_10590 [Acidimicrobiales bacterium]
MREGALEEPRPATANDPGVNATRRRSRKFVVGAVIAAIAPIAVTGTAWANGCVCG